MHGLVRRHVLIAGRVQGVWFRESCRDQAAALKVHGWVRNLRRRPRRGGLRRHEAAVDADRRLVRRGADAGPGRRRRGHGRGAPRGGRLPGPLTAMLRAPLTRVARGPSLRSRRGCSSSRSRSRASSRSRRRRRSTSSPASPWSSARTARASRTSSTRSRGCSAPRGPRTLRGGKMDDVIFAGTPQRQALGRAEVSLTIDNTAAPAADRLHRGHDHAHAVPQRR